MVFRGLPRAGNFCFFIFGHLGLTQSEDGRGCQQDTPCDRRICKSAAAAALGSVRSTASLTSSCKWYERACA